MTISSCITRHVVALFALAFLFSAPAVAHTVTDDQVIGSPETTQSREVVTGDVRALTIDDRVRNAVYVYHRLELDDGSKVAITGRKADALTAGSRVTISGRRAGNRVEIDAVQMLSMAGRDAIQRKR